MIFFFVRNNSILLNVFVYAQIESFIAEPLMIMFFETRYFGSSMTGFPKYLVPSLKLHNPATLTNIEQLKNGEMRSPT